MRPTPNNRAEEYRVTKGQYASDTQCGNNGMFRVPIDDEDGRIIRTIRTIASNGGGWEHVSVSIEEEQRCPVWAEMAIVKDLFWLPGETVVQYHPPRDQYINLHPYCLHLWRPIGVKIPLPPQWMVG